MAYDAADSQAFIQDYYRSLPPSPREAAQQRGYIGQGLAGIARGVASGVARPINALAAIPGVRAVAEPLAEGIENLAPYPSGGVLEQGIESGVSSLVTGGLTAAGFAATVGTGGITPLALAGATGLQFGLSELTQSRQRLEKLNEALSTAGQTPLTQGEIYAIAGTRGLIEAGGETLGNFIIGHRLLAGPAAQAVKNSIGAKLPGFVGRALREGAFIGAEEIPTEAGQAAGQAAVERSILGPERVAALEAARQPVDPAPGIAARQVVAPTAISSLLFGGVAAVGGRARPAAASGEELGKVVTETPPPSLQSVGASAGTEGVILSPNDAAQARFQAAARAAANRPIVQAPLAPTGSDTASPIQDNSRATALIPFGALERDTIPPAVRAEALGQSAVEIQQRLSQLDALILERGYGRESVQDLQPLLDRQAFYQQILQDRLNEGVTAEGEAQRQRFRPLPFDLPAGPQDSLPTSDILAGLGQRPVPTQRDLAGIPPSAPLQTSEEAFTSPVSPATPLPSALEAGLARRNQDLPQASPLLEAQRRDALDFLTRGQAPRTAIRGLTQEQAVDALLTQAIEQPQAFFANLSAPGGRQGVIRVLTRAGFRPFEAQELLNRTLDLVQEPPPPSSAPETVPPPPPAPAPTPPPLVPVTPREAPPILPSAPADQATPRPAVAVPEAPRVEARPGEEAPQVSGQAPPLLGNHGVVRTEENRVAKELGVPYLQTQMVIEDVNAARNSFQPGFPEEKQPRIGRRGGQGIDQAAEARLIKMLNDPQFERLLDDADASRGAPLRDQAGDVVSGNLRDEFLRRVYQQGGPLAERLRAFVQERATQLGIDPAQVATVGQPVIRRVLATDLTPEQIVRFAEEANVGDISQIDPVSAALQDARRLTPEILDQLQVSPSGTLDLRSASNDAFRRDLKQHVFPVGHHDALFDSDGNLNNEGEQRTLRAIFAAGYGADTEALTRLANSADESRKRLAAALQKKAGVFAVLANDMQTGRAAALPLGPHILEAANFLNRLEPGESVRDRLNQGGLFGTTEAEISPEAQQLLLLFDDPYYRNSGEKLQRLLQTYHDLVRQLGDPRQTALDPTSLPSRLELVAAADAASRGGLPSGPTPSRDRDLFTGAVSAAGAAPGEGAGVTPTPQRPSIIPAQRQPVQSPQAPAASVPGAAAPSSGGGWTAYGPAGYAYREVAQGKFEVRDAQGEILAGVRPSSEAGAKSRITRLGGEAQGLEQIRQGGVAQAPPGGATQGTTSPAAQALALAQQRGYLTITETQRALDLTPGEAATLVKTLTTNGMLGPPEIGTGRRHYLGERPGQLQVGEPGQPGRGPVTLEEAQRTFRNQAVSQREDGVIVVRMPQAGHVLEIHNVAQITPTTTELELGYGQQVLTPTQDVLGRETPIGQGIFRIEVTSERTNQTLYHEGEHFFEDSGLLTSRDIETLNRTLRRRGMEETAEHRADLVADLLNARELLGGIPGESTLASIGRKVQQFLDTLARLVGLRTTGQIVRSIESGSIFERQGETTQRDAQGRLMVAAFNRGEETGKAAGSVVRDAEGNLQAVYHGTGAMFDEFALEKKGSAAGQMFDGIFFAEDPGVASKYAESLPRTAEVFAARHAVELLESEVGHFFYNPSDAQRWAAQRLGQTTATDQEVRRAREIAREELKTAREYLATLSGNANVRPVYLNIQHPFDMTAEVALDASEIQTVGQDIELQPIFQAILARGWDPDYAQDILARAADTSNLLGSDAYRALAANATDENGVPIGKAGLTQALQDVGYDGIFHIGRQDGRVWVAFHPDQIIPAFQAHGRLQVVNKDVPDATPRRATYETELKSLLEYNSWSNALTPPQIAYLQQLNNEGHAFFKKEFIPVRVTDALAMQIVEDWKQDPAKLARFRERMRAVGTSALQPSAASESQARALMILAQEQFQLMFALRQADLITPEAFGEFEAKWDAANSVAHYATEALSIFGRGLRQAQEDPTGLDIFLRKRQELADLLKSGKIPEQDVARLRADLERAFAASDITTLQAIDPKPPTLKNLFWELYYASLYNVGTWSTNLWSTTGHMLFQNGLVEPLAGQIDKVFSRVGDREQQIYSDVALRTFRETLGRLPQSFKSFWWLWRNSPEAAGIAPFHRTDSLTQREMEQKAGAWSRATYPSWHPKAGEAVEWMRRLAPAVTFTSRALEAMDVAMREQTFDARMAALSAQAAQQALGHEDATWQRDWQQAQVQTQGPAFQEAFNESKVLTFHDQTSLVAQLLLGGRKIPGLGFFVQLLFPFAKTPDRLLARGLELLPGPGFARFATQAIQFDGWMPHLRREAFTPDASLMMAKQMVGTLMAASLWAAWAQGLITGGAPEDPGEREAFFRSGKVPYSLRVGETWYSWRRFEPMSLPLSIATSVFEAMQRLERRQTQRGEVPVGVLEDSLSLAAVAVQSMVTNILDSSYFAGAAQFLQATQRGRETGDIPKGVLRQIATMVTPWGSIQRSAIRAVDSLGIVPGTTAGETIVRQPEGLLEHIDSLWLPGAYLEGAPKPRLDIFGRAQHRLTSFLGELVPGIPPVERGYALDAGVEGVLQRLHYFPGQPAKLDAATGKAIPAGQYRRLQEIRGPLLQQKLESLVNQAGFDRLTPEAQKKALQAAASAAGHQARQQVAAENLGVSVR